MLGMVTIGQTPRPDFEAAFKRYSPDAEIRLLGALDGFSYNDIFALAEEGGAYPLHARLADDSTCNISMRTLAPLVEKQAQRLAADGADLIVVLCAGGFPEFESPIPLLLPGKILPAVSGSLSPSRHIGVVTPIWGQVEPARQKWQTDGFSVQVTAASPFDSSDVSRAAAELSDPSLDLVVLDCMGHDEHYRSEFARHCLRPVLLAQTLVARIAAEMMAGCKTNH